MILYNSDEAATYCTGLAGWVSRDGRFFGEGYGAESAARYSGCTHRACGKCGKPAPKAYSLCDECRQKAMDERYYARPIGEWDGKSPLYSEVTEEFYSDPEGALEDIGDLEGVDDPQLIICHPVYARRLDDDYFSDRLPDDAEVPEELAPAIDAFNTAVAGVVLSWQPGNERLAA